MARKAVLLVEDDEQDREIYSRLLYYNGYDLLFADTGEEGVRLAGSSRPDLVLLDIVLPGMDGFETCRELRRGLGPDLPIIMLSAMDEDEARPRAMEAGATKFIAKPAPPLDVVREVRALIGYPSADTVPDPAPEASGEPGPAESSGRGSDPAGGDAGPGPGG